MARIFISHSHVDEAEAIALSDWLISQGWGGEDDIFLDLDPKRGLVGGERWQEALKRNARRCEAIVFLITPAWCKSDWCRAEFLFAKNLNKPIFGIIAKPIELSDIPIEMTAEWQLVDLTREGAQEDFSVKAVSDGKAHNLSFNASELTRLKAGLESTGIDPCYFEWPPEDEPNRAPYQGLRAMQSQDAGIFFGRDGQILEGLDRLRGLHDAPPPHMLVILGASGAGKSSYMRAGLLPRLKRDDRHFVVLDSIRPGGNVLSGETGFVSALKHTLEAHDIASSPRRIKQAIGEALDEGSETSSLHDLLHQLASSHVDGQVEKEPDENNKSALPSIVIPIDQAEELYFNQDESGASEAKQFRQLLSILARDERLNIILLLTIRSDSYQHMQLDTVLGGVEHQTLSLPPIAQGSYSQIISGPVQRLTMNSDRKLAIEEKLVERLLHDIAQGGAKDALPLLAFTLERLYSEYLEGDTLTLQDYEEMGGIRGSIEAAVEQAFKTADQRGDANIPMEKQARLALLKRGLIPYLASVDPEHNGAVRRVAPLSSIPQEARPIMELLVEQRLLATDTRPELDDKDEPTGKLETTIEPAHEALLRQWGQLGEWLEEDREALSALDGVKRAVIEWDANDKGDAFLAHTAGRLESAEQVANDERFHDYLNQRDRNYLAACRKADNERRNQALEQQAKVTRRTRLALITVSILALFIGGIGFYAFQQKQVAEEQKEALAISLDQANLNQSKFLRSSALSAMSEGNYDEARGLMKEAWNKIGGTYDPENPWSDYLAAAQRRLEYNDPLLMTLDGHGGGTNFAQFSPDGKKFVTASRDGTARLWDAKTGAVIAWLTRSDYSVKFAQFSPDSKMIAAISGKTVMIWDVKTGERIVVLEGHDDYINSVYFSPDTKMLVTASNDETARVWHIKTEKTIGLLEGHEVGVQSARFSPDSTRIVTTSLDGYTIVWNVKTEEGISAFYSDEDWIYSAQFGPEGETVLTTSVGGYVIISNANTGEEISTLEMTKERIDSAEFSPDGNMIVTVSNDNTARVWNAQTGEEIVVLSRHGGIFTAQFSPDGSMVVTTSEDDTVSVWDVNMGEEIAIFQGHNDHISTAQFSPDSKKIITASNDKTVKIWDVKKEPEHKFIDTSNSKIIDAHISANGHRIVITFTDATARVFNISSGEEIAVLKGLKDNLNRVQFSPDGNHIASVSANGIAKVWNTTTGREIFVLNGHELKVLSAQFSPDGMRLVTASADDTARIWDAKIGKELLILRGHENWVYYAQFSPDSKTVVTSSRDRTARLWNAKTGDEITVFEGHNGWVDYVQFSPDGKTVITSSRDQTTRLWNAESGKNLGVFYRKSSDTPLDENFLLNSDGHNVLTDSMDNKITLADVKSGEEIYIIKLGKTESPISASFIPTSNAANERFIALSSSGKIISFEISKLSLNTLAELNLARQMNLLSKDNLSHYSIAQEVYKLDHQILNPCDAAGGHPFDPERIGPVLEWQTLTEEGFNREEPIEACEIELAKQPDEQRLRFQLARALLSTQELENEKRAVDLYLEASENGYAIASYSAAIRYERGNEEAIKLDPKRSLELYELASSQGIIEANSPIAWAYWDGVGTSQDKPKAILTWQEGAKKSDPFSHKRLAQLYVRGEVEEENTLIKQDINKAFYHYALATKIFEEAGDEENAQETRYRRASLARILPQDDVVRIWREVKAWQSGNK